jgi:hypothetical protein
MENKVVSLFSKLGSEGPFSIQYTQDSSSVGGKSLKSHRKCHFYRNLFVETIMLTIMKSTYSLVYSIVLYLNNFWLMSNLWLMCTSDQHSSWAITELKEP